MEWYSPAGEDFVFTFHFDGSASDFVDNFRSYAEDFDPDEHAEMWVEHRGKNGCPNSIRDLIDDADAINDFLNSVAHDLIDALERGELSNAYLLTEEQIRDDWEAALESDMDYSEIAQAIEWGFTREDIITLMELHRENKHRRKIEDLLTDCNYHTECKAWSAGDYTFRDVWEE